MIPKTQNDSRQPLAVSGLKRSHQARRLRRARPLLDPLEERCLLNFGSPSLFDTGGGANNAAVAIGDVNGDGIPDLVTATTKGGLSIAQGYGNGTFQTPVPIAPFATSFSAVKLVDLDGRVRKDGSPILDIVAADPADDELWVLMNDGTGTFAAPTSVPVPGLLPLPSSMSSDPSSMAVAGATANLNGDTTADLNGHILGDPGFAADIVIANPAGNNVIVLLGTGSAADPFVVQPPITVGDDPVAVALGDFDNSLVNQSQERYPDIITANEVGNSVSVLLGEGNGTFRPTMDIPITVPTRPTGDTVDSAASSPSGVAVGDFNGDGNLDFVTANSGWASVNVVLGNGDGSFGTQQTISTLTYNSDSTDPMDPDPPTAIVAADLSGDGFVDIAFTEPKHNSIGVLTGNGNGTFATRVDYPAGESPAALVIGDLNGQQTSLGNDRLDLVAVDFTKSQVSILLGQKLTTTTTLDLNVSTITWGGAFDVTPVVNTGYASQTLPLTGSYQLVVDGADYSVPQPLNTALVLTELPATTHKLYAIFLGDDDYQDSTTSTSTITVVPAELTVTANDYSRAYGAADPAFTYSITGFVNGDKFEQSDVPPTCTPVFTSTDTVPFSSVGNYTINISQPDPKNLQDPQNLSYSDLNYVIDQTFNPGTLTITPAPLTITAGNRNWTYGTDVANAGSTFPLSIQDVLGIQDVFTVSFGQLYNGDTVGSVTLTTNATLSTSSHYNAGTWPITPSAAIFSSGSSSNYAITYANASTGLTVVPLALYMTGGTADSSKVYDGSTNDPLNPNETPQFQPGNLLSSKSGTDAVNISTGSANFADPNVGTNKTVSYNYSISGDDAADYTLIQPPSTTANITPATLVITALDQNPPYGFGGIQYGGTNAALGTTDFTAFVEINNDPNDLVNMYSSDSVTSVTLSTDASLSNSHNYNVALPDAAPWTITPSSPIGKGLSNYTITYDTGTLTISKMDLTVTPLPAYRTYGSDDTSSMFSPVLTGFLKGDGEDTSELSGGLDYSCTDGYNTDSTLMTKNPAQDEVGTYTISITQPNPNDPNYSTLYPNGPLTYKDQNYTLAPTESSGTLISAQLINGTLTIDPAPLTITALPQTQDYGFDGTVNSDGTIILPGTSAALTPGAPSIPYTKFSMISSGNLFNNDSIMAVLLSTDDAISSSSHYNQ